MKQRDMMCLLVKEHASGVACGQAVAELPSCPPSAERVKWRSQEHAPELRRFLNKGKEFRRQWCQEVQLFGYNESLPPKPQAVAQRKFGQVSFNTAHHIFWFECHVLCSGNAQPVPINQQACARTFQGSGTCRGGGAAQ